MGDNSFTNKVMQKMADWYAKILWKKTFTKTKIQENDNQIISVVQEVYLPPEERKSEVWDWILDQDTSFLMHAAYLNHNDNVVLICYRWTDFKNVQDIVSDVQIVLWVNSIDWRVKQSLEFFDQVQMKYPDAKKWICGHSLGWTISYIVTEHRNPERCVVFNPGAAPTRSFVAMLQDTLSKKERTKKVTTYKIWWDVISLISFVGNVKSFVLKEVNPLKLHSIDSFPALFETEKSKN